MSFCTRGSVKVPVRMPPAAVYAIRAENPLTRLRAGAAPSLKLWCVGDLRWAQARPAPAGESAGRGPPSPSGEERKPKPQPSPKGEGARRRRGGEGSFTIPVDFDVTLILHLTWLQKGVTFLS